MASRTLSIADAYGKDAIKKGLSLDQIFSDTSKKGLLTQAGIIELTKQSGRLGDIARQMFSGTSWGNLSQKTSQRTLEQKKYVESALSSGENPFKYEYRGTTKDGKPIRTKVFYPREKQESIKKLEAEGFGGMTTTEGDIQYSKTIVEDPNKLYTPAPKEDLMQTGSFSQRVNLFSSPSQPSQPSQTGSDPNRKVLLKLGDSFGGKELIVYNKDNILSRNLPRFISRAGAEAYDIGRSTRDTLSGAFSKKINEVWERDPVLGSVYGLEDKDLKTGFLWDFPLKIGQDVALFSIGQKGKMEYGAIEERVTEGFDKALERAGENKPDPVISQITGFENVSTLPTTRALLSFGKGASVETARNPQNIALGFGEGIAFDVGLTAGTTLAKSLVSRTTTRLKSEAFELPQLRLLYSQYKLGKLGKYGDLASTENILGAGVGTYFISEATKSTLAQEPGTRAEYLGGSFPTLAGFTLGSKYSEMFGIGAKTTSKLQTFGTSNRFQIEDLRSKDSSLIFGKLSPEDLINKFKERGSKFVGDNQGIAGFSLTPNVGSFRNVFAGTSVEPGRYISPEPQTLFLNLRNPESFSSLFNLEKKGLFGLSGQAKAPKLIINVVEDMSLLPREIIKGDANLRASFGIKDQAPSNAVISKKYESNLLRRGSGEEEALIKPGGFADPFEKIGKISINGYDLPILRQQIKNTARDPVDLFERIRVQGIIPTKRGVPVVKGSGGKYELPGGGVELYQTFESALRNELKQELGVKISGFKRFNIDIEGSIKRFGGKGNYKYVREYQDPYVITSFDTKSGSLKPQAEVKELAFVTEGNINRFKNLADETRTILSSFFNQKPSAGGQFPSTPSTISTQAPSIPSYKEFYPDRPLFGGTSFSVYSPGASNLITTSLKETEFPSIEPSYGERVTTYLPRFDYRFSEGTTSEQREYIKPIKKPEFYIRTEQRRLPRLTEITTTSRRYNPFNYYGSSSIETGINIFPNEIIRQERRRGRYKFTPDVPPFTPPKFDLNLRAVRNPFKIYRGRKATRYTPSFSAIIFNIRGRRGRQSTGLSLRAIPRGFNFTRTTGIKTFKFKRLIV